MPSNLSHEGSPDADRFARLAALFERARELSAQELSLLLEEAEREDPALVTELGRLLRQHDDRGGILSDGAQAIPAQLFEQALESDTEHFGELPEMLGPYRPERLLGQGGMGSVYLARRAEGDFEQRVAIKVLRADLNDPDLVRRFRAERRMLAGMEHPYIASLYDGGELEDGRPYVVMEYVEGEELTTFANSHGLSLRDRLELFCKVCSAVEHAHRNLVVHRDIKPSNILVQASGDPKLVDFGIAKRLGPSLDDQSLAVTQTGLLLFTPGYASPEQVCAEAITTASDVYSLGAVLYELIAGVRAHRFETTRPSEYERVISSVDPLLPSDAAASADPPRPPGPLKGDLDKICLMAMRKEPDRRYASVAALAADVQNHLKGWPVSAQVDSWRYRTGKFLSRHAVASVVAALFLALVAGFSIVSVAQRNRALGAEKAAGRKAHTAQATSAFLIRLFATADPREGADRNVTALDLLRAGLQQLTSDESLEPEVRADLRLTLGLALANLDEFDDALPVLRACVDDRVTLFGAESLETAEAKHRLGDVLRRVGDLDGAFALLSQAQQVRRRLIPEESYELADSLNNLAILAADLSNWLESLELQIESVAMHTRLKGPDAHDLATPLNNLGLVRRRQGKYREALALAQRSQAILEQSENSGSTFSPRLLEARSMREVGRVAESRELLLQLRVDYGRVFGPDSSRIVTCTREIAQCDILLGDHQEAQRGLESVQATFIDRSQQATAGWVLLLFHRAKLATLRGQAQAAEDLIREALDLQIALTGPGHRRVADLRIALAARIAERGDHDGAREALEQALHVLPSSDKLPWLAVAVARTTLARVEILAGRLDAARAALDPVAVLLRRTSGEDSVEAAWFLLRSSELAQASGDTAQASNLLAQATELFRRWLPTNHPVHEKLSGGTKLKRRER